MSGGDDGRLRVDRRTTLKWLAATMATAHAACSRDEKPLGSEIPPAGSAPGNPASAPMPPAAGYGTDPDLMHPAVPWPRTMSEAELSTAAALSDVILPADRQSPAASSVGVPDFVDEWVSAPYPQQQSDRELILAGLDWLERESRARFGAGFTELPATEQETLVAAIAAAEGALPELAAQAEFFSRFRWVAVGAYYTTAAGNNDIGYVGNVPLAGPYPGPSDEAMAHLAAVLERLGLSLS